MRKGQCATPCAHSEDVVIEHPDSFSDGLKSASPFEGATSSIVRPSQSMATGPVHGTTRPPLTVYPAHGEASIFDVDLTTVCTWMVSRP